MHFFPKIFAYIKKKQYFCRRFRRSMTSLLCNSCNCLENSSMIKTHVVSVLIIWGPQSKTCFAMGKSVAQNEGVIE